MSTSPLENVRKEDFFPSPFSPWTSHERLGFPDGSWDGVSRAESRLSTLVLAVPAIGDADADAARAMVSRI